MRSRFLCLAYFRLLNGCGAKTARSHMQGQAKNGTASNRDNVFESGFTLAAGILDALKPDWKATNSSSNTLASVRSRAMWISYFHLNSPETIPSAFFTRTAKL
jgi:hypothetical protein